MIFIKNGWKHLLRDNQKIVESFFGLCLVDALVAFNCIHIFRVNVPFNSQNQT
jgi:hypothetical protein